MLPDDQQPLAAELGIARFSQNSSYGAIAGLCNALGSLLTGIIVAHSLGVENTGVIAFALWIAMFAAAVADLGIQATLARYLPELIASDRPRDADRLAAYLQRRIALSCCAALALFICYGVWDWRTGRAGSAVWGLIGVACALQALAGFTYGYLRGIQRFHHVALTTAVSLGVQLVLVAVGSLTFGIPGALVGYCAGSAVPAALALRSVHGIGPLASDIRVRAWRYALYAWAGALSSTLVWSRAEVFFLNRSTGSAAVGLFTVGVTLANLASQGPMLLTAGLLPYFAQRFGKGAFAEMGEAYAAATRMLAFLVFPACFGMAAVLPVLLPMLYGQDFAGAIPAASILLVGAGIGSAAFVGSSLVMAVDRSDFIFLSGLLAAALTVIAGFTVIPASGLMGAACARAAIQVAVVAFGSWFIYFRLRFPLPFAALAKLLLAALSCGAAARLCLLVTSPASLPAAILSGGVVYLVTVRALRALPASDIERLRAVVRPLPGWLRSSTEFALWVISPPPGRGHRSAPAGAPAQPLSTAIESKGGHSGN